MVCEIQPGTSDIIHKQPSVSAKKQKLLFGEITENQNQIKYMDICDMTEICRYWSALSFKSETCRLSHSICHQGKVMFLSNEDTYSQKLKDLLSEG